MASVIDAVSHELGERGAVNLRRLVDLVAIQSVSAPGSDAAAMWESAAAIRDQLREIGLADAGLVEIEDAHPYVFAELHSGDHRPTLLLYAHHDVQPAGELDAWTSDPFRATERDGRLFGRGTADDKGGLIVHIAAIEAWLRAASPPVNIKVLVDGEEEIGSPHLPALLERCGEKLRSDVVVIPDSMNWTKGEPALTSSLRGVLSVVIELRALATPLHSGIWGGLAPDPLMALCRLLASLVEADGSVLKSIVGPVAQGGMARREALSPESEADLRQRAGLRPQVGFIGDVSLSPLDRLWEAPSLTILGIDVPRVRGSSNTIQPAVRARISLRLPPEEDPEAVRQRLTEHIHEQVPWSLECDVVPVSVERGWRATADRPAVEAALSSLRKAYDRPATIIGMGGSLPAVAMLRRAFGDLDFLLTGVEDHESRTHGIDESLDLAEWRKACLAESLLFEEIAAPPGEVTRAADH